MQQKANKISKLINNLTAKRKYAIIKLEMYFYNINLFDYD